MAKIKKKRRKKIFKAARKSLNQESLGKSFRKQLLKRFGKKGAQGVLNAINAKRESRGLEKLKPGEEFSVSDIPKSRSDIEKFASFAARKAKTPKFKEQKVKAELEEELGEFFDEETSDLEQELFDEPLEDLERERSQFSEDIQDRTSDLDIDEERQEEAFALEEERLATAREAAAQQRSFTEFDEDRSQNISFGQRGVSSLSPAAQRLAERLQERQEFREKQQELGFTQASEDITRGRETFAEQIKRARRGLFKDFERGFQERDISRDRLGKRRERFKRGRDRDFKEQVGRELDQERQDFLIGIQ